MNGRRAVVGLCMLCALLVSAFAAQSASAISGTTAFTCTEGGQKDYAAGDVHCQTNIGANNGTRGHVAIAQDTTTELTGESGSGASVLKSTVGGVGVTLSAATLSGTGTMENKVEPNGEHYAEGTGTITYTDITVSPFTKCFVYTDDGTGTPGTQGVVHTEPLLATTTQEGHNLKFTPETGDVFARFWILDKNKVGAGGECTIHGTYTVTGSVTAQPDGATAKTVHNTVTTANTLKLGQGATFNKAGIEGSLTIKGRAKGGGTYNPLTVTTVTT